VQHTVVALLVTASLVVGIEFGLVPALLGGCLAATVAASWLWRPTGVDEPQDSDTP